MASIDTIPNGFSVRYRVDGKSVFCYCVTVLRDLLSGKT